MGKVLVVGWGKSGQGSVKLLQKRGYETVVYDDHKILTEESNQTKSVVELLANIDFVVVSPAIANNHAIVECARKCNIEVISEIELGYRCSKNDIIAITGTNGKTTTTMLMTQMLNDAGVQAYSLGNIGTSYCGELADDNIADSGIIVLEVSSFQLEHVDKFAPKYAVCLNVTPDHLERHHTMEEYALTKMRIFGMQSMNDVAVLNYDDEITRNFADGIGGNIYYISLTNRVKGAYVSENKIYFDSGKKEFVCNVDDIAIKGEHNISNALACIVIAKLVGLDNNSICKTLGTFKLPRYRIEFVTELDKKKYYNDSKATNIDSTLKACETMQGDTALIVGGYDKGIAYDGFFSALPSKIKHIIACGDNALDIMEFLPPYHDYTFEIVNQLERALELASCKNVANVLFSPTTSSFDRYCGYEQRGEHFNYIVREMQNEFCQNT
ncbi:MAG: UDP-N-acetylmuramoyl-L-alanine--D-glutamate ligase [Clostridia bacterium]